MESLNCTREREYAAAAPAPACGARPRADEQAFRTLVAQHHKRLRAFILRHIGHRDDADDLAQQAFMAAAAALADYRGEAALSTWVYGIAMNLVRNHLSRAPHRRHAFEDAAVLDAVPAVDADPREHAERRELLAQLEAELALLPAEMREVLLLVAVEELSYEDAAALLVLPVGTVRSRVSRARATLRQRCAAHGLRGVGEG